MTSSPAIAVSGLSKSYRIHHRLERPTTAAEAILTRIKHPLRRSRVEWFQALDDVSFQVHWGDAVGIIGRNGAGKSTLLKLLTRITAPSRGRIELRGRVGSLLEVGTGFHPELTGRENIYLNGTLLGMTRKEIGRRFDEIVAFSGVEKFLDTPVKRFSSGMHVRLGFSVAAHLDTEILAIDEVLAVGDAEFQAKCIAKMRDVARNGRTVLFVSHQIQTVQALCTSAMYLHRGRLMMLGSVQQALEKYKQSFELVAAEFADPDRRPGTGEVRVTEVKMATDVVEPTDDKIIEFTVSGNRGYAGSYFVSTHINNADGSVVAQCDSRLVNFWLDGGSERRGTLTIKTPWLKPGRYTADMYLCRNGIIDALEQACSFQVIPVLPYPGSVGEDGVAAGLVFADFEYETL